MRVGELNVRWTLWQRLAFLAIQVILGGAVFASVLQMVGPPDTGSWFRALGLALGVSAYLACAGMALGFVAGASGKERLTVMHLLTILAVAVIASFRLVSLPFLVLAVAARHADRPWLNRACWAFFVAASVCPADVAVPGYPGWPAGISRPSIRLVPVVPRMWSWPSPEARRQEHMEYNFPSLLRPFWVVVWWHWPDEPLPPAAAQVPGFAGYSAAAAGFEMRARRLDLRQACSIGLARCCSSWAG